MNFWQSGSTQQSSTDIAKLQKQIEELTETVNEIRGTPESSFARIRKTDIGDSPEKMIAYLVNKVPKLAKKRNLLDAVNAMKDAEIIMVEYKTTMSKLHQLYKELAEEEIPRIRSAIDRLSKKCQESSLPEIRKLFAENLAAINESKKEVNEPAEIPAERPAEEPVYEEILEPAQSLAESFVGTVDTQSEILNDNSVANYLQKLKTLNKKK